MFGTMLETLSGSDIRTVSFNSQKHFKRFKK